MSRDHTGSGAPPTFVTLDQVVVQVRVGHSEKPYIIHKQLLTHHSNHFRAAFEGGFKEATDGCIRLEHVEHETFRRFQQWLYAQMHRCHRDPANTSGESEIFSFADDMVLDSKKKLTMKLNLYDLYIFADRYDTPQLRHDLITAIVRADAKETTSPFCIDAIPKVYTNLLASSPLCTYLANSASLEWMPKWKIGEKADEAEIANLPHEFMYMVVALSARRLGNKATKAQELRREEVYDPCTYHEHAHGRAETKRCRQVQWRDRLLL